MVIAFFGRIARAAAKQGLAEIAKAGADPTGLSAVNYLGKVASEVWHEPDQPNKPEELHAEILEAAKLTFEEAKQAGLAAAQEATTDPELQGHIERLVTLIPASIRTSLRRPEDPTGTTLPYEFQLQDEQDITKLLPVRLPRYKAGDTPLWLRGWRLVEQIGAGGFGEVWKVQNTRATNLLGAVKFSHGLTQTELSLLNEGNVLNRLLAEGEHDGIVPLQDLWADGDPVPWIRFKYIAGGDLTTQIHRWQTLPVIERLDKVITSVTRLAKTVGYFHRLEPKIVHRDLKPSNILFEERTGKLLIADFGIGAVSASRAIRNERSQSQGAVLATFLRGSHTPLYASPQQKLGSRLIDPHDDVHAIGVIAYQMLTGQLDSAPGADIEEELSAPNRETPDWLIALIKCCVAREPNRRPVDGLEIEHLLKPPAAKIVRASVEVQADNNLQRESVSVAPAEITSDPVTQYAAWKAQVEDLRSQSVRAAELFDYTRAVELYSRLPPKQRDESMLAGWTTQRDRLARVWGEIETGWKEMTENELAGKLDEVLLLHPHHPEAKLWRPQIVTSEERLKAKLAKLKAGDRQIVTLPGGVKMTFAWCPPGNFMMGSPIRESERENDELQYQVTLTKGFFAGVYPVTQAQWVAVMGTNPSNFKGDLLPVEHVSWEDTQAFCAAVKKKSGIDLRLLTEAEWEYAARGGTTTTFYWGDTLNGTQANCDGNHPYGTTTKGPYLQKTTPVGTYAAAFQHPWGLCDVIGNVWEWCEDWYDAEYYRRSSSTDPVCREGEHKQRVLRGGSWYLNASYCRTAYRYWFVPSACYDYIGFRLCLNDP